MFRKLTLIWTIIILIALILISTISLESKEIVKLYKPYDTLNLIAQRGFKGEIHSIKTENYTLHLYRIINPLANPKTLNKYPVLYGHGITFDSSTMLANSLASRPRKPVIGVPTYLENGTYPDNSDDHSLPFLLSNNNFDVWVFDARGSDPKDKYPSDFDNKDKRKYWDYTLDDQALNDLPQLIDYVLAITESKKVVYFGFSTTTYLIFALLSTAPDYNDKIAAAVTLAPVSYISKIKSLLYPIFGHIFYLPDDINYSYLPQFIVKLGYITVNNLCRTNVTIKYFCNPLVEGIGGPSKTILTPKFFESLFKYSSLKSVKQFKQMYVDQRFGMFDHGPEKNLKMYGQLKPPRYDLSRIKSDRIIIVRGYEDYLSIREDQERLIREMGVKPYKDIVIPSYNHFDFVFGQNITSLVNVPVLKAIFELIYKDGPSILKEGGYHVKSSVDLNTLPQTPWVVLKLNRHF